MGAVFRYALAVAAVAVVLGLKLALVPWVEQDTPFLLFFAAVLVASWFGGLGPGLLATALSAAASAYFFMRPYGGFWIDNHSVLRWRLAMFVAECGFVNVLVAVLQSTRRRADAATAEARRLERGILEASEAERRQIGHDLHEGLGQQLAGASFRANLLSRRLAESHGATKRDGEDATEAKAIEELLNHSVAWTRDLATGLSPVRLRADGLAAALEELVSRMTTESGTTCVFEGDDDPHSVRPEVANQLFHIAREAAGDAVRRAKAARVVVGLTTANLLGTRAADVVMTVRYDGGDAGNGHGVRPEGELPPELRTIEYRARLAGVNLVVRRLMPAGTELICTAPSTNRATLTRVVDDEQ